MENAVQLVSKLSSVQATLLLKQLNQTIYGSVPYADMKQHLDTDVEDLAILTDLDPGVKKQNLDAQLSTELTRKILMSFAEDAELSPVLLQAWDKVKNNDSLFVETIVALGLVANLTIFMATSEMKFKIGTLTVNKKIADKHLIKEILAPITAFVKKIPLPSAS